MDGFQHTTSSVVKCQNCGADMVFDPVLGKLHCHYCDSTRDIVKRVPMMRDFDVERFGGDVKFEQNTYTCPNCGGEVKLPAFATAIKCPFCSATNVVKNEDINGLKPDSILPFVISQESACLSGKKWVKRKLYAPYKLKKEFEASKFKGIYIPAFSFSTPTTSQYRGRLGETRTRTVGSGKNRHTETYIHWFNVSGTFYREFADLSIEASTQLTQKEHESINPYDYSNAEAYNNEYIAGFEAERYDTSLSDSFAIARNKMMEIVEKEIMRKHGADHKEYLKIDMSFGRIRFRYTLLPLWVCAYAYKNKSYRFIVNGRTGKTTGKAPVSTMRVLITVLLALGVVGVIVWLVVSQKLVDHDIYYTITNLLNLLRN